jgi:hypothetical protein
MRMDALYEFTSLVAEFGRAERRCYILYRSGILRMLIHRTLNLLRPSICLKTRRTNDSKSKYSVLVTIYTSLLLHYIQFSFRPSFVTSPLSSLLAFPLYLLFSHSLPSLENSKTLSTKQPPHPTHPKHQDRNPNP